MYHTLKTVKDVEAIKGELSPKAYDALKVLFAQEDVTGVMLNTATVYPDRRGPNCICGFDPRRGRLEDLRCPDHGFLT